MLFQSSSRNSIRNKFILVLVFASIVFSSCLGRKEIEYFQKPSDSGTSYDTLKTKNAYEPKIQTNDQLQIQVASINPEAARFFNPSDNTGGNTDVALTTYMVDLNGEIEIPLVGKMKIAGMTTREFRDELRIKLEKYLQSPTVRVNYNSYKVTVLGEVNHPGLYQAANEKLTITDAIGLAGDLTIYGNRKQVMLIREEKGQKSFFTIDLTKRDIFESDLHFMHPGDILYIPAGKGRIASADNFYRIVPIVLSTFTFIILIIRLNLN